MMRWILMPLAAALACIALPARAQPADRVHAIPAHVHQHEREDDHEHDHEHHGAAAGHDESLSVPMQTQFDAVPTNARSSDYSDGIAHADMHGMRMLDNAVLGMLLMDRLEAFDARNANGLAFEGQAWLGNDANKLWLTAEGERSAGDLQALRAEALWDRPLASFWDTRLGVRHDGGAGPDRSWVAFGVRGLAPYWFELEVALYLGPAGRSAVRTAAEYELLLTQQLILQPRLEMNAYGRNDPARRIGAGISDLTFGLRLRYEFNRQFAPYVGIEAQRRFGTSADFARADGETAFEPRLVAGVRVWF